MNNVKYIIICVLFFTSFLLKSQNNLIYLFKDRYNIQTQSKIEQSSIDFREIKILGGYMIDPKRKGIIDLNAVNHHLKRLYPIQLESGLLCINLENRLFQDIRNNGVNTLPCKNAINEFIDLILFVKSKRPNLKVGIYGMPFTVYYDSQLRRNSDNKLDMLLCKADVIFPSLYIFYPDKQKGLSSNLEYFEKNLRVSFDYANRLGKPVIPFIWYFVHPSNKRYRSEIIPKEEMVKYMDFIFSYSSVHNTSVLGVVWWDTPTPFLNNNAKSNLFDKHNFNLHSVDDAFNYYFIN